MEIADNDRAVIRFVPATLTVNEGAGNQTLQVQLAFNTNGTGPQTIQNQVDVIIDLALGIAGISASIPSFHSRAEVGHPVSR